MHQPLTKWFCDKCGEVIENVDGGQVAWKLDCDQRLHDFRIVHSKCDQSNQFPCWEPLKNLLGTDGLSRLLSYISLGPFLSQPGTSSTPGPADKDKFVDLVRRIQLPYYEEARRYFSRKELVDRMIDDNEMSLYRVERLRETIEEFEQR